MLAFKIISNIKNSEKYGIKVLRPGVVNESQTPGSKAFKELIEENKTLIIEMGIKIAAKINQPPIPVTDPRSMGFNLFCESLLSTVGCNEVSSLKDEELLRP